MAKLPSSSAVPVSTAALRIEGVVCFLPISFSECLKRRGKKKYSTPAQITARQKKIMPRTSQPIACFLPLPLPDAVFIDDGSDMLAGMPPVLMDVAANDDDGRVGNGSGTGVNGGGGGGGGGDGDGGGGEGGCGGGKGGGGGIGGGSGGGGGDGGGGGGGIGRGFSNVTCVTRRPYCAEEVGN